MNDWIYCGGCKEDWPPEDFSASGSAYDRGTRLCNACYLERYPRRTVHCTDCGRKFNTRGKAEAPRCRPCYRGKRPPGACVKCGRSAREYIVSHGGECWRCYHSRRKGSGRIRGDDGTVRLVDDPSVRALSETQCRVLEQVPDEAWVRAGLLKRVADASTYLSALHKLGLVERKRIPSGLRFPRTTWGYQRSEEGSRALTANRANARRAA